ncbi:MAG: DUF72 domain-containing protein [Methanomicrobiaceae archaeon]|nr:DUF72 domain-containing protein [Methanomicrobiaceae archaeon]
MPHHASKQASATDVFVGTSGWYYDWNSAKSLECFAAHSGLNAIELNFSFYRFPTVAQAARWAEQGGGLRWSVKVHRSVTHRLLFSEQAQEVWERFSERFAPLDASIDFFLFQAPPRLTDAGRVLLFAERTELFGRFALELRNPSLLGDDDLCRRLQEDILLVSVDSPDFANRIFSGDVIYLRMHGRNDWYRHDYTEAELDGVKERIAEINPRRAYIFFNNDHAMLKNARAMRARFP